MPPPAAAPTVSDESERPEPIAATPADVARSTTDRATWARVEALQRAALALLDAGLEAQARAVLAELGMVAREAMGPSAAVVPLRRRS
ncbi:MAG: hypothetical protein JST00_20085 [Deltaproteobacteria bacterium]|nr:hypothetical protein [Deltaproteobacteria bacterium]